MMTSDIPIVISTNNNHRPVPPPDVAVVPIDIIGGDFLGLVQNRRKTAVINQMLYLAIYMIYLFATNTITTVSAILAFTTDDYQVVVGILVFVNGFIEAMANGIGLQTRKAAFRQSAMDYKELHEKVASTPTMVSQEAEAEIHKIEKRNGFRPFFVK